MKRITTLVLSLAAFTLAFAVPQALSAADDAATIKKNMAERKPKIETLKKAGTVGEKHHPKCSLSVSEGRTVSPRRVPE